MELPTLIGALTGLLSALIVLFFAKGRAAAAPVASAVACEQGVISALLSAPEALGELRLDEKEQRKSGDPDGLEADQFTSPVHALAYRLFQDGERTPEALRSALISAGTDPVIASSVAAPLSDPLLTELDRLDGLTEAQQRDGVYALSHPLPEGVTLSASKYTKHIIAEAYAASLLHRRLRADLSAASAAAIGFAEAIYSEYLTRPRDSVAVQVEVADQGVVLTPKWVGFSTNKLRILLYALVGGLFGQIAFTATGGEQEPWGGWNITLVAALLLIAAAGSLLSEVDFRSYIIDDVALLAFYLGAGLLLTRSVALYGWLPAAGSIVTAVLISLVFFILATLISRRVGRSALGSGDVLLIPAVVIVITSLFNWKVESSFLTEWTYFLSIILVSVMSIAVGVIGGFLPAIILGLKRFGFGREFPLGPYLVLSAPAALLLTSIPTIATWVRL